MLPEGVTIRNLQGQDLETLLTMDWRGLPAERSSIYLLFCVHFQKTSLVAEHAGKMMAILVGSTDTDSTMAYLNHIVIWKEWEGKGVMRELMNRWFALLKERGVRKVWLHGSLDLYRRFGFQESNDIFHPAIMAYYKKNQRKVLVCELEDG